MVPTWIGEGVAKAPLRDLLEGAASSPKGIKCRTCSLLSDLSGDDLAALSEALSDPKISAPMIAKALDGYGVRVSPSAISRHRRECGPVE